HLVARPKQDARLDGKARREAPLFFDTGPRTPPSVDGGRLQQLSPLLELRESGDQSSTQLGDVVITDSSLQRSDRRTPGGAQAALPEEGSPQGGPHLRCASAELHGPSERSDRLGVAPGLQVSRA